MALEYYAPREIMASISEEPVPGDTAKLLQGAGRDALRVLKLDQSAEPHLVVDVIDAFVDAWQEEMRPPKDELDPDDAPYAMGSLWGEQLVRQFKWDWAMVTFHDHGNSKAPGVLSPDRALAIYPIHFLLGCFRDRRVDCTVALSFNLLVSGEVNQMPPRGYFNLMEGVRRIVPKR